jgi:hypothetical protein
MQGKTMKIEQAKQLTEQALDKPTQALEAVSGARDVRTRLPGRKRSADT